MIRSFNIRNFIVHKNTAVTFQPLTLFVGANGAGKSSIFDALLNYSILSRRRLSQAFQGYPFSYGATLHRATAYPGFIRYETVYSSGQSAEAGAIRHEVQFTELSGDSYEGYRPLMVIKSERIVDVTKNDKVLYDSANPPDKGPLAQIENDRSILYQVRHSTEKSGHDLVDELAQDVARFSKYRFDAAALAGSCPYQDDVTPFLGYSGEGLAGVLAHLSENDETIYTKICDEVKKLLPEFDSFEISELGNQRLAFSVRFTDERGVVPALRLSSGLLTYIGLVTLVARNEMPTLLMIEEPENGLHPQAIRYVYQQLFELSRRGCQVMVATHSPILVCEAWNSGQNTGIYRVKVIDGASSVREFGEVIAEQGIQLRKVEGGKRGELGLAIAEQVMSGEKSGNR